MNGNLFSNQVAVVTGSSRGIGQAIALAFARQGACVVGISSGSNDETAAKARDLGVSFTSITSDFSKLTQKDAANLMDQVVRESGRVDILVNNAGIIRRSPAVDYSESDWNQVLQVNLNAPFFLCQAAARWWLGGGREQSPADSRLKIVNIASMLSFQGGILIPAYTASKSGMAGITRALANEWAKERINVNAIAPGYVATENTRPIRENARRNESILERIPEGRWADASDIADSVVFLASPQANYVNGAVLNVDGGWLAR